jgi:hypothetical protein
MDDMICSDASTMLSTEVISRDRHEKLRLWDIFMTS